MPKGIPTSIPITQTMPTKPKITLMIADTTLGDSVVAPAEFRAKLMIPKITSVAIRPTKGPINKKRPIFLFFDETAATGWPDGCCVEKFVFCSIDFIKLINLAKLYFAQRIRDI